jgi:hypothetical protein
VSLIAGCWREQPRFSHTGQIRSVARAVAFLVIVLAASSCGAASSEPIRTDGVGAVVRARDGTALVDGCGESLRDRVTSYWTPPVPLVDSLDPGVRDRLREALEQSGRGGANPLRPEDYITIYGGVRTGTDSLIYVNGIHRDVVQRLVAEYRSKPFYARLTEPSPASAAYWRTHGVSLCDGGRLGFSLAFNLKSRRFSEVVFSGPLARGARP